MRDGLGDRDVSLGPRARPGAVQAQHADHPVEDDHRRREDGARAEPLQDLAPAEERVFELRRVAHVGDRDRASLAGRQVGGRQALDRFFADRRETLGEPLSPHRQPLARLAEPQEAAGGTEGAARLGDGHARNGVEIVHGTDAPRDLGHQSLAREGLVQGRRRPRPVERDCRLACDRLHQPELLRRERAPLARRRKDEHAGHPLVGLEVSHFKRRRRKVIDVFHRAVRIVYRSALRLERDALNALEGLLFLQLNDGFEEGPLPLPSRHNIDTFLLQGLFGQKAGMPPPENDRDFRSQLPHELRDIYRAQDHSSRQQRNTQANSIADLPGQNTLEIRFDGPVHDAYTHARMDQRRSKAQQTQGRTERRAIVGFFDPNCNALSRAI